MGDDLVGSENGVKVGVIGFGYVGLPLAVEFGKKFQTVGVRCSSGARKELREGLDRRTSWPPATLSRPRNFE